MFQETSQAINWTAVNTGIGFISFIVIGAAAYLRMFVKGELISMEKNILIHIESKFSTKEVVTEKLSNIERRITKVEALMERIRLKKTQDDERG